jgi:hypothetical protein
MMPHVMRFGDLARAAYNPEIYFLSYDEQQLQPITSGKKWRLQGALRIPEIQTQIFSNEYSCFRTHSQCRIVCVRANILRADAQVYKSNQSYFTAHDAVYPSVPASFSCVVPYTLSRLSTTPPLSRGFIAQVPNCETNRQEGTKGNPK